MPSIDRGVDHAVPPSHTDEDEPWTATQVRAPGHEIAVSPVAPEAPHGPLLVVQVPPSQMSTVFPTMAVQLDRSAHARPTRPRWNRATVADPDGVLKARAAVHVVPVIVATCPVLST